MSLVRCSGCDQRNQDKFVQVNWAWRRQDGVRVAYRGRLCNSCFASKVGPLSIDYTAVDRLTCPGCGIDTEDDMDAVYTTSFVPGYGPLRTESPFCGACAANYRVWVLDHSHLLEDPLGATGGPQPTPSGAEILTALGIAPRER